MVHLILTGFATAIGLIVAIGAQNAFVLQLGLRREHLLPIALICAFADALLIFAGIAGMGVVIEQHSSLLALTRGGGLVFLLWYGVQAARRALRHESLVAGQGQSTGLKMALLTCLALTFLNPHVYLDTVLLLGTLGSQYGESGKWFFGVGAVMASFCWFFSLAYGARFLAPLFGQARTWRILDAGIAMLMMVLAGKLLFAFN